MRTLPLLLLLPSFALAGVPRNWSETQATGTRAAPTLATEGMGLSDVSAYGVRVCATTGTLTASWSLQAYLYHEQTSLWMRVPGLDITVPAAAAGLACVAFPDLVNALPRGRVLYAANGAGASVTVYLEGWAK
jgi:hypothetical protein